MHPFGSATLQPMFAASSSSSSAQSQTNQRSGQQQQQQQQQQNHIEHVAWSEPKDIVGTEDVSLHTGFKDEVPSKSREGSGLLANGLAEKQSFVGMRDEPPLEYMSKSKEGSTRRLQESHSRKEEVRVASQQGVKMQGKQPKDSS
mmetsp:Transcript_13240/g.26006  ORF Transcript_13240/g.26006 Transcript_13240/m.26006 type:complete len:145 (-) Transcript_13240:81-515(-)